MVKCTCKENKQQQNGKEEQLEQESQWKYISGRGIFSFYKPRSKELAQKNIFYFVALGFKAETFSLE